MLNNPPRLSVVCRDVEAAQATAHRLGIQKTTAQDKTLRLVAPTPLLLDFLRTAKTLGEVGGLSYVSALADLANLTSQEPPIPPTEL